MKTLTRNLLLPSLIGLSMALLGAGQAHAVAGFARQTGMSCNACHTLHGAPTPNFTFTGKKFNALGYRLPGRPHTVQDKTQEQLEPEDRGEYMQLLPLTFSGRLQYSADRSKSPGSGDWGEVVTNPTSRLALFPFIGPIGHHFGVWTEIYVVPFTSEDSEWSIADTTYEEFDFRYIINPNNMDYTIGLSLSNQSVYGLFGFDPFPVGVPSEISRGGVGGFAHPNRAQLFVYGWMNDRWVWAAGGDSGDTNYDWEKGNAIGMLGYAINNRNDNELWVNLIGRKGSDALPLVTASGAQADSRSWQYRDAIGGISDTRRAPGGPCPGFAGRRPQGSCAYLSEELDDQHSIDVEVRYGAQSVDRFFGGDREAGPWSYEIVGRYTTNKEDYIDGAGAKRNSWGVGAVLGYKHTYYFKPSISDDIKYEFTDIDGIEYDIDRKVSWNLTFAYKPVEQFLLYLSYSNSQSNSLLDGARSGRSIQLTADISF